MRKSPSSVFVQSTLTTVQTPNVPWRDNCPWGVKFLKGSNSSQRLLFYSLRLNGPLEFLILPAFQDSDKNVIRIKIWIAFKKAQIPIEIRYPPQPVLFNSKNSKLEDLVTICIKTFERYPCLNRLIESIESKYPKINIIIADDSFNYQSLETKNYQNVVQYQMPGGTGFNKGKNLAISQVCLYFSSICSLYIRFHAFSCLTSQLILAYIHVQTP